MTRARLDQINIVVRDMDATTEFYRRLGVDIQAGPAEWAPHHRNNRGSDGVDLDLDSEQFASVWNQGWPGGPGVVLGFRLPDRQTVDRLFDELTSAGYGAQQPPYDAFWGSRYAVVTDPDGNAVGMMSPADDDRRTAPPSPPAG
ncbi:MAG: VOC family protein [Actinobacteria bacterium]|nr:VOC family protein [Actinomycetota bacterium]